MKFARTLVWLWLAGLPLLAAGRLEWTIADLDGDRRHEYLRLKGAAKYTLSARDVDADEDADLVLRERVTGRAVALLVNDGRGGFAPGALEDYPGARERHRGFSRHDRGMHLGLTGQVPTNLPETFAWQGVLMVQGWAAGREVWFAGCSGEHAVGRGPPGCFA
jgi:hypothetical protein